MVPSVKLPAWGGRSVLQTSTGMTRGRLAPQGAPLTSVNQPGDWDLTCSSPSPTASMRADAPPPPTRTRTCATSSSRCCSRLQASGSTGPTSAAAFCSRSSRPTATSWPRAQLSRAGRAAAVAGRHHRVEAVDVGGQESTVSVTVRYVARQPGQSRRSFKRASDGRLAVPLRQPAARLRRRSRASAQRHRLSGGRPGPPHASGRLVHSLPARPAWFRPARPRSPRRTSHRRGVRIRDPGVPTATAAERELPVDGRRSRATCSCYRLRLVRTGPRSPTRRRAGLRPAAVPRATSPSWPTARATSIARPRRPARRPHPRAGDRLPGQGLRQLPPPDARPARGRPRRNWRERNPADLGVTARRAARLRRRPAQLLPRRRRHRGLPGHRAPAHLGAPPRAAARLPHARGRQRPRLGGGHRGDGRRWVRAAGSGPGHRPGRHRLSHAHQRSRGCVDGPRADRRAGRGPGGVRGAARHHVARGLRRDPALHVGRGALLPARRAPPGPCCATTGCARPLRRGDLLLFEEVRGPDTGLPGDADPTHRHVVRVTGVRLAEDPLATEAPGQPQRIAEVTLGRRGRAAVRGVRGSRSPCPGRRAGTRSRWCAGTCCSPTMAGPGRRRSPTGTVPGWPARWSASGAPSTPQAGRWPTTRRLRPRPRCVPRPRPRRCPR